MCSFSSVHLHSIQLTLSDLLGVLTLLVTHDVIDIERCQVFDALGVSTKSSSTSITLADMIAFSASGNRLCYSIHILLLLSHVLYAILNKAKSFCL